MSTHKAKQEHTVLRALPLILVSLTLRPLTTSVGPVLPEIRQELALSATQASLLTVLPVICFAIGAFLSPRILAILSPNQTVAISLALIFIGGNIRLNDRTNILLLCTVVCGLGAAIGNILGGIIARRDFTGHVGLVMVLYVGTM